MNPPEGSESETSRRNSTRIWRAPGEHPDRKERIEARASSIEMGVYGPGGPWTGRSPACRFGWSLSSCRRVAAFLTFAAADMRVASAFENCPSLTSFSARSAFWTGTVAFLPVFLTVWRRTASASSAHMYAASPASHRSRRALTSSGVVKPRAWLGSVPRTTFANMRAVTHIPPVFSCAAVLQAFPQDLATAARRTFGM